MALLLVWRWFWIERRLALMRRLQREFRTSVHMASEELRVLELVAQGESLPAVLDTLTRTIEAAAPGCLCTILLLDEERRRLRYGAAPSLPGEFSAAIDGLEIGPEVGACGSAAFRNETVIVEDVATDYRFARARDLLAGWGLRACWSVPVQDSRHNVLGTFAMYHRHPARPSDSELLLVTSGAHLAGLAIERLRAKQELLANAERFRLMERVASFGLWEADLKRRTVAISEGLAALHGDEHGLRTLDIPSLRCLVHPDDFTAVRSAMGQLLAGGEPLRTEFRFRRADGSWRWQRCHVHAHFADGQPVRLAGISIDITSEKELQACLEHACREAESATRAKGEFLANMSHEIRTPMNGIIGAITLLTDTGVSAEQREYLDTIQSCGDALLNLVNDILDLSKAESGKLTFEQEPFDVEQLMAGAVAVVAPMAAARGLELRRVTAGDVPPFVCGDRQRIGQVLLNLLSNAVKFTERGSITLGVSCGGTTAGGVELQWTVQDTGIGIPAEVQERIFDPFTQADSSTTRRYGGTGLGLTICRRVVMAMGGRLELESQPGLGSTFRFTVPLALADSAPAAASPNQAGLPRSTRNLHILLAEDDLVNQRVAARLLERMGHRVDVACDGRQAVELAGQYIYDLILMDRQMPVMSGSEATRAIRMQGRSSATPIFAMTASSAPEDRRECLEAGMTGYLVKPVSSARLFQLIESLSETPG
ncbi:MAG TPA: ATP-binding protein [Bryobacteraceae bacterium]|nr:ATP-binding protein [Bryobacteraceae bacterium]